VTGEMQPSAIALERLKLLIAAGYATQRRHTSIATACSLHHPSRRRRRGAPPSLLVYEDGLVATYPQLRQGRLRFAPLEKDEFNRFLHGIPVATILERIAPTVSKIGVFGTIGSIVGVTLWAILNGQVAVTSFVTHLILFSAPFVAIRLFLR
jgi:hypothetical protein